MSSERRFGGDESGAVIVCRHVANGSRPILRGRRDQPVESVDTGWQFRCNVEPDESPQDAKVWSVADLLSFDGSVSGILEEPFGTIVERPAPGARWTLSRFDPEAVD